jgi:Bacterial PH domain
MNWPMEIDVQVFEMASHGLRPAFWIVITLNLLFAGFLGYALRSPVFSVVGNQFVISGSLWGRSVPVSAMRLADARTVDLGVDTTIAPIRRVNGVGLPGFRGGWFKLANGERALVFVGKGDRAIYIPSDQGFSLLIAPADPVALLAALAAAQD